MQVAIIDYNSGNVQSVKYALERLGANYVLTDDIDTIRQADKVIFPGQGEASSAMKHLKNKGLVNVIKDLKQPFFGVCLGLQLLCKHTAEGDTDCLGIFDIEVKKFSNKAPDGTKLKVPQMGWNNIAALKSPLFKDIKEDSFVYFVHSYYAELSDYTIAQTNYGVNYSAALHKDNFYANQFHPEKSSKVGSQIIKNFLDL